MISVSPIATTWTIPFLIQLALPCPLYCFPFFLMVITGVDNTQLSQAPIPPLSFLLASLCQDVLVKLIGPSTQIPLLFWLPHELAQLHHQPCYATIPTCCDGWLRQLVLRSPMHLNNVLCSKVNRNMEKKMDEDGTSQKYQEWVQLLVSEMVLVV